MLLLADAIERAASADRAKIIAALEASTFAGHVMPYGPTKFVNGQNQGAAPVNTQVLGNDIQVIFPAAFARRSRCSRCRRECAACDEACASAGGEVPSPLRGGAGGAGRR